MVNNQVQESLLGSFVITVMLIVFSWIGLTNFSKDYPDSLDGFLENQVDVSKLPLTLLPEIKTLERATRYESKLLGAGASLSMHDVSLEKIKNNKDAGLVFQYLLSMNNPVAQLYGLKGMKDMQSNSFKNNREYFLDSKKQIQVVSGCSVNEESISQIVMHMQ